MSFRQAVEFVLKLLASSINFPSVPYLLACTGHQTMHAKEAANTHSLLLPLHFNTSSHATPSAPPPHAHTRNHTQALVLQSRTLLLTGTCPSSNTACRRLCLPCASSPLARTRLRSDSSSVRCGCRGVWAQVTGGVRKGASDRCGEWVAGGAMPCLLVCSGMLQGCKPSSPA